MSDAPLTVRVDSATRMLDAQDADASPTQGMTQITQTQVTTTVLTQLDSPIGSSTATTATAVSPPTTIAIETITETTEEKPLVVSTAAKTILSASPLSSPSASFEKLTADADKSSAQLTATTTTMTSAELETAASPVATSITDMTSLSAPSSPAAAKTTKSEITTTKVKKPAKKHTVIASPNAAAVDTTTLAPVGETEDAATEKPRNALSDVKSEPVPGTSVPHRKRLMKESDMLEADKADAAHDAFFDESDGARGDSDDAMDDFIEDDTNGAVYDRKSSKNKRNKGGAVAVQLPMQPIFTPSATGIVNKRRFLAWTAQGSILSLDNGVHHIVEIEFADQVKHKTIRLRDFYHFRTAALGQHGAVMASKSEKAGANAQNAATDRPSAIFYRPFDAWTAKSEWTHLLPKGENALCVAMGDKFVACATDRQWVRIFTHSGLQRVVLSVAGPIVSLTAHETRLCVVHHHASPFVNAASSSGGGGGGVTQSMSATMYCMESRRILFTCPVALSPSSSVHNTTLTWLALSDSGMLCTMDSCGVLRGLSSQWGRVWVPLLDTRNVKKTSLDSTKKGSKDAATTPAASIDTVWPIGVFTDQLMCVQLKGTQTQPLTQPRPLLTQLKLQVPFIVGDQGDAATHFEEQHFRSELLLHEQLSYDVQQSAITSGMASSGSTDSASASTPITVPIKQQAQLDKTLLQLFTRVVTDDRAMRALDLATLMGLRKTYDIAVTVANHYKKPELAKRVHAYMLDKFAKQEQAQRTRAMQMSGGGAGGMTPQAMLALMQQVQNNSQSSQAAQSIQSLVAPSGDEAAKRRSKLATIVSGDAEEYEAEQASLAADDAQRARQAAEAQDKQHKLKSRWDEEDSNVRDDAHLYDDEAEGEKEMEFNKSQTAGNESNATATNGKKRKSTEPSGGAKKLPAGTGGNFLQKHAEKKASLANKENDASSSSSAKPNAASSTKAAAKDVAASSDGQSGPKKARKLNPFAKS